MISQVLSVLFNGVSDISGVWVVSVMPRGISDILGVVSNVLGTQ